MNLVVISGRMGQDPEIRTTQNGTPVCNFGIAETVYKKGQEPTTQWHSVVVWQDQATRLLDFGYKGREVTVQGRLQNRAYKESNSQKERLITEIVATRIDYHGDRKPEGQTSQQQRQPKQQKQHDSVPF